MWKPIKMNRKFLSKVVVEYNPLRRIPLGMVDESKHALNLIVSHEDGSDDYNK